VRSFWFIQGGIEGIIEKIVRIAVCLCRKFEVRKAPLKLRTPRQFSKSNSNVNKRRKISRNLNSFSEVLLLATIPKMETSESLEFVKVKTEDIKDEDEGKAAVQVVYLQPEVTSQIKTEIKEEPEEQFELILPPDDRRAVPKVPVQEVKLRKTHPGVYSAFNFPASLSVVSSE
jgi:hypothetical protein